MHTAVVAASIPSNVLDPKPRSAEPASQHTIPAASESKACHCAVATGPPAAVTPEANGDGSSHDSSAVNGGPDAAEQYASTSCQAAGNKSPILLQGSLCPHSAEQPLSEEAGQGRAGSHTEIAGLQWDLPEGVDLSDCLLLWLGDDDAPALTQLMLTFSRYVWCHISNPRLTASQRPQLQSTPCICFLFGKSKPDRTVSRIDVAVPKPSSQAHAFAHAEGSYAAGQIGWCAIRAQAIW